MKVFLPYRGEFGFNVMAHAPQVHAALKPGVDVVFCEHGNEALYPGAAEYIMVGRREDAERRVYNEGELLVQATRIARIHAGDGVVCVPPDLDAERSYFAPEPYKRRGITAGVVICPRRRDYGSDKNWQHWQVLADLLRGSGRLTYAAGAPDSSFDIECDGRAWEHKRFLDASIEVMLSAQCVIATDAGLAHLAVMCGRPLLLVSHGAGLVANGCDDLGRPYWPIRTDRFAEANHCGAPIRIVPYAWSDPWRVFRAFLQFAEALP